MPPLPRMKPDPLPPVRTTPEALATGDLKHSYEMTKRAFGVPWMGVVAMAFAGYPKFYDALWQHVGPVAGSTAFAAACAELRATAEAEAQRLTPASLVPGLKAQGYSDTDLAAIDQVIEVFSEGNMPYLLLATIARLVLEGVAFRNPDAPEPAVTSPTRPVWPAGQPLVLIEAHHQNAEGRRLYEDIRTTLGLPFVNTDYRALARWPGYFAEAWGALRGHVGGPAHGAAVEAVHARAVELALGLPGLQGLSQHSLAAPANAGASADEVQDVVRLFQWLLPGLAVNVGYFRHQLTRTDA
ncbi:halocarboxylic acid dehydrogenase DehI family protein [Marinovum sp.]|uniref:halocarboxylic acid dehydrogenase DehI family protein n=1 Tax=Marinovum sp. TaxID=2024839 RepID=UPI003A8CA04B